MQRETVTIGSEVAGTTRSAGKDWRCFIFDHDMQFEARGRRMDWSCRRGCDEGGSKVYPRPEDAARFSAAFNRRSNDDLGRRAPLIGLLPLRLWHRLRGGSVTSGGDHVQ